MKRADDLNQRGLRSSRMDQPEQLARLAQPLELVRAGGFEREVGPVRRSFVVAETTVIEFATLRVVL